MDSDKIKRRAKRIDFSAEIKIRFEGQTDYISLVIKDISGFGLRAIIAGRLIKIGEPLEIKMCINDRDIYCKGKVAWVLMLRPSLGNINVFDVGVKFYEINVEDREFLEKIIGK